MSVNMWREEQGPECAAGLPSNDVSKWLRDIIVLNVELGASTFRPETFLPSLLSLSSGKWVVLSQLPH